MGCDIHMHTEVKKTINGVEKWVCADYFKKNPYFGEEGEREIENIAVWQSRDYKLFALLAGVRNHFDIEEISEIKGLPDDCNKEIVADHEYWGDDGHSHSWLTLRELVERAGEYEGLDDLIKLVAERARRFWVYADTPEDLEKVRIVFWFDN